MQNVYFDELVCYFWKSTSWISNKIIAAECTEPLECDHFIMFILELWTPVLKVNISI